MIGRRKFATPHAAYLLPTALRSAHTALRRRSLMSRRWKFPWPVAILAVALLHCGNGPSEISIGSDASANAGAGPVGGEAGDAPMSPPALDAGAFFDASSGNPPGQGDAASDVLGTMDAGAPAVRFIARVDRTDPAGARFDWSGSTILARFTGSSIGVRLSGKANYFDVRIDGTLQPTLVTSADKQAYPLASNLAAGPHELSVFRRTEARQGETTFMGLILDPAGALLPPPPPSGRRLEIVGDSTTCGYGDEGKDANCPFTPATENYDVAYGAVAARVVGAELITIAWSAKGMYRNFAGDMNETMPVL